jgi:hypothetical protein
MNYAAGADRTIQIDSFYTVQNHFYIIGDPFILDKYNAARIDLEDMYLLLYRVQAEKLYFTTFSHQVPLCYNTSIQSHVLYLLRYKKYFVSMDVEHILL